MLIFPIENLTNVVNILLPEPHSSLLNGIVYGRQIPSYLDLYLKIKKAGILHIVVLSGSNIAMLGAMMEAIFGFVNKKIAVVITICFILLFAVSVGFEPPVVRASIMGSISLLAVVFNRKATALYSLLISAIISSVIWPEWITSVSFLLSYAATLGIILFGTPTTKPPWWLPQELRISLVAQLFTTPIIFIYFKEISLVAPFTNLLISIIIGPLMALGLIISILGSINHVLAVPFAFLAFGMLEYLLFITDLANSIPYSFITF